MKEENISNTMNNYDVVSFDIFDTCVLRTCGTPSSFLDVLSYSVFSHPVDEMTRQRFIVSRIKAENRSYNNKKTSNIYDIYKLFCFDHPHIKSKQDLVSTEIELEKKTLVPVNKTKELIDTYRNSGKKIYFISDMYLPSYILQKTLYKLGLYKEGDKIFVSCDSGHSKQDGTLFRYIKESENISYNRWVHYGDNMQADCIVPSKLGIRAFHINHDYSSYETSINSSANCYYYNYRGIAAGLSRAILHSEPTHPRNKLLIDIVAPLYCSFLYTVFEDATKRGISKLFFCARDCYQLFQIAKVLNKSFPNISIHYLYISREALRSTPTDTLLSYFIQEGLASNHYLSGIIDATTTGLTQEKINNILERHNYNKIFSYSIIKYDNPSTNFSEEHSLSCCGQMYVQKEFDSSIFNNHIVAPLIECIFSTNAGKRTIGYSTNKTSITPIFSDKETSQECIQDNIDFLQYKHTRVMSRYAEQYLELHLYKYSFPILTDLAFPLLCSFVDYPIKEYTEGLLGCYMIENNKDIPIIRKERIIMTLKNRGKNSYWRRATILYNIPKIRKKILKLM